MQKKYGPKDYAVAVFVTAGCAIFVLYGVSRLPSCVHWRSSAPHSHVELCPAKRGALHLCSLDNYLPDGNFT